MKLCLAIAIHNLKRVKIIHEIKHFQILMLNSHFIPNNSYLIG